jgi:hypothetical protein
MRWVMLAITLASCGAAAPPVTTTTTPAEPTPVSPPATFAGHGPLTLRSIPATTSTVRASTQVTFYAELAPDGGVTGTRCGATRFTDEGVLEREGESIARVDRDGDALVVRAGTGDAPGWRIEGDRLLAPGATPFAVERGSIVPGDTDLPEIALSPADTSATLALAFFATLLVCDDVGP